MQRATISSRARGGDSGSDEDNDSGINSDSKEELYQGDSDNEENDSGDDFGDFGAVGDFESSAADAPFDLKIFYYTYKCSCTLYITRAPVEPD